MIKSIIFSLFFSWVLIPVTLISQTANPIIVNIDYSGAGLSSPPCGGYSSRISTLLPTVVSMRNWSKPFFRIFQTTYGLENSEARYNQWYSIINQSSTNPANPRYARISIAEGEPSFGLSNAGFRGMGIKKGMTYHFSVLVRQLEGSTLKMHIGLVNSKGEVIGTADLAPEARQWKKYTVSFAATVTEPKAKLNIWFEGRGSFDIDMISLFPDDTWKNRPGGLRADLVQLLADLKPGFLRFPGGCIVEGRDLDNRYQWKNTIGNIEDRHLIVNRWNTEFAHRLTPDYFQSFGMGFLNIFNLQKI